jgi:hypothetical protein
MLREPHTNFQRTHKPAWDSLALAAD